MQTEASESTARELVWQTAGNGPRINRGQPDGQTDGRTPGTRHNANTARFGNGIWKRVERGRGRNGIRADSKRRQLTVEHERPVISARADNQPDIQSDAMARTARPGWGCGGHMGGRNVCTVHTNRADGGRKMCPRGSQDHRRPIPANSGPIPGQLSGRETWAADGVAYVTAGRIRGTWRQPIDAGVDTRPPNPIKTAG